MKSSNTKTGLKISILSFSFLFLNGCLSYLWHASNNHIKLMSRRISIERALEKYSFSKDEREKLKMIPKIKHFAKTKLGMDIDEDVYSTYIQLGRPYVTYLLRVSEAYALKPYTWYFPVVGRVPYKGFFDKELAKREAKTFPPDRYDTIVRGVTAYSTLGWTEDSVLSSMLLYNKGDFTVTVFHELAHTVLFFSSHINFNERFAEFVGRKSAELFFRAEEGENSKTLQIMRKQWADELIFSAFMEKEYNLLDQWYKNNKGKITVQLKAKRLKEIQERFLSRIQPQMKTSRYNYFSGIRLNNARLLSYRAYNYRMDEFEKLYALVGKDMKAFIEVCSQFDGEKNPEAELSRSISKNAL